MYARVVELSASQWDWDLTLDIVKGIFWAPSFGLAIWSLMSALGDLRPGFRPEFSQ